MTITVKSILSSSSPAGVRLDTFQVHYPDWFHPELMTHRDFSRNASSTRAIPTSKLVTSILEDPATPFHWGLNEKGMQARQTLQSAGEIRAARALWKQPLRHCIAAAVEMNELLGLHKQVCGRLLSPWMHKDVILSATNWENFFATRCHPDAEPGIRVLAWKIADLYYTITPTPLQLGEWHLPYIRPEERTLDPETLKKCSAARCGRVSYRTHDGQNPSVEKDMDMCTKLLAGLLSGEPGEPGHMSPFEHVATPLEDPTERSGNFQGWKQYRKEISGERMSFNYQEAVARGWRDLAMASYIDDSTF